MANIVSIDPGSALAFTQNGGPNSSFGPAGSTFGQGFRGRSILNGDRFQDLDRRAAYYLCTQHDSKAFDFEGRVSNPRSTMPLLSSEKAHWYVPLRMRRPSAPYRIGKIIVDAFTSLLFGENRFPHIRVDGDPDTEDYAQTLARVARLPQKMIQARNMGGSTGTVGLSWCFYNGKPRFEVHDAKNLHVHSWEDRVALIPRHVSEVYLFYRVLWDGKGFNRVYFWYRRDWTPDWDIVFREVAHEPNKDPYWVPDMEKSVRHDDKRTHFEWIQNLPTDEEDGLPDYEGLYDQMDTLDVLCSVVTRGATLNLDPTLMLKLDPDLVDRRGIRKGSDNALVVGEDGDAKYLELEGTSVEAGIKLIEMKRRAILEAAQCVVPDPHEVAAQGVSSLAAKMMYAPMLAKSDVFREQYGAPVERALDAMLIIAKETTTTMVTITNPATGEDQEGQFTIELPPKIEMEKQVDPETGEAKKDPATGKPLDDKVKVTPRKVGEGGEINLRWPPYFPPTPDDQTKTVTNMNLATGGKAFISKDTATEIVATAYGIDPAEEKRRVNTQSASDKADQAKMFPAAGGAVGDPHQLPPGAKPKPGKPGGPPPPAKGGGAVGGAPKAPGGPSAGKGAAEDDGEI